MMLKKLDKRMFEYLSHLKFGQVDHKTLSWKDHLKLPSSDWQFPTELESYFLKCFFLNKDIINDKDVLDIGCEYGNKIPWFDKFKPKKITCIDPSAEDLYIAKMVATLVDTDTECVRTKAEDYQLKADTIFMLSVNHHLDDEFSIYDKLECDNLIIDTWTDKTPIQKILEALEKKFMIESKIFYKKDRLILRCKRKTNLNFLHQIPIKVQSGSCATNLKVEINGYTVFDKTFAENSSVNYVLEFDHSYKEGVKNKICFKWTGPAEHENKYLKIEHIIINDQIINLYNAEYFPHIGDQWWNTLQDNEKEKYNEIIYGKAGNTFGWYGEINFYFCTGNNFQSRHSFNKSNRDPRKLLNEQNDWIFLDKSHSKLYHKAKQ
mgnify:FL=1|tara:strand:+ start:217 stop:1347 length:1131 start_codon:yes stop_codon:yes gene_type:complete